MNNQPEYRQCTGPCRTEYNMNKLDDRGLCPTCQRTARQLLADARDTDRPGPPLIAAPPPPRVKSAAENELTAKASFARRLSRYKVTQDQYRDLIRAAKGRCEICQKPFNGSDTRPSIDRCHGSGKARGALCTACVGAVSRLSPHADAAARYLRRE